jgi:hypothetical protein
VRRSRLRVTSVGARLPADVWARSGPDRFKGTSASVAIRAGVDDMRHYAAKGIVGAVHLLGEGEDPTG